MPLTAEELSAIDRRTVSMINAALAAQGNNRKVDPIGFVPGITVPIGEPMVVTFTIAAPALDTGTDQQVLSAAIGFLWQEVSMESDGIFEWVLKTSGYDTITTDGSKIHSNTFKGDGQNGDIVWGHKLPTAMFMPGGTTMIIECTDLANSGTNDIRMTFTGARVRPGSPFRDDLVKALNYNGLG